MRRKLDGNYPCYTCESYCCDSFYVTIQLVPGLYHCAVFERVPILRAPKSTFSYPSDQKYCYHRIPHSLKLNLSKNCICLYLTFKENCNNCKMKNSPSDAWPLPVICALGWSTVREVIDRESAGIFYKSLSGDASSYMSDMVNRVRVSTTRSLRNSDFDLF